MGATMDREATTTTITNRARITNRSRITSRADTTSRTTTTRAIVPTAESIAVILECDADRMRPNADARYRGVEHAAANLAMFNSPQLEGVAQEVEDSIANIMEAAG